MYVVISGDPNLILGAMLTAVSADFDNKLLNSLKLCEHNTQTREAIVHADEGQCPHMSVVMHLFGYLSSYRFSGMLAFRM